MRVLLAIAAARRLVQLEDAHASVASYLRSPVDVQCFNSKCGGAMKACSAIDPGCKDRSACMDGKDSDSAADCFAGVTLADLSKPEADVVKCAQASGCLTLSPEAEAFLQAGYDETHTSLAEIAASLHVTTEPREEKPDFKGLKAAEEHLKDFTKRTENKIASLKDKTRANEEQLGLGPKDEDMSEQDPKYEDSLLELPAGPDRSMPDEDLPRVDRIPRPEADEHKDATDNLLDGIETMLARLQQPGEPSLLEIGKHVPELSKLERLDDTTMIVALGALAGSLGLNDDATSFLQEKQSPVQTAYKVGMHMGTDPTFLSSMFGHPGYLPKEVIESLGLKAGKRAPGAEHDEDHDGDEADYEPVFHDAHDAHEPQMRQQK